MGFFITGMCVLGFIMRERIYKGFDKIGKSQIFCFFHDMKWINRVESFSDKRKVVCHTRAGQNNFIWQKVRWFSLCPGEIAELIPGDYGRPITYLRIYKCWDCDRPGMWAVQLYENSYIMYVPFGELSRLGFDRLVQNYWEFLARRPYSELERTVLQAHLNYVALSDHG